MPADRLSPTSMDMAANGDILSLPVCWMEMVPAQHHHPSRAALFCSPANAVTPYSAQHNQNCWMLPCSRQSRNSNYWLFIKGMNMGCMLKQGFHSVNRITGWREDELSMPLQ